MRRSGDKRLPPDRAAPTEDSEEFVPGEDWWRHSSEEEESDREEEGRPELEEEVGPGAGPSQGNQPVPSPPPFSAVEHRAEKRRRQLETAVAHRKRGSEPAS